MQSEDKKAFIALYNATDLLVTTIREKGLCCCGDDCCVCWIADSLEGLEKLLKSISKQQNERKTCK